MDYNCLHSLTLLPFSTIIISQNTWTPYSLKKGLSHLLIVPLIELDEKSLDDGRPEKRFGSEIRVSRYYKCYRRPWNSKRHT